MNFKNKRIKRLFQYIPLLGFVLVVVSSCSTSKQLAGESDGIYFNPEKDQRMVYVSYDDTEYDDGNLVRIGGKYFDEDGNAPIIENQKKYYENNKQSKYSPWGNEDKQTNVSINYMVSPFYSGFGFNYGYGSGWYDPFYYGGYSPYYYGINSGYLWNSPYYYAPYSWDPFYSPYVYYSPYYYGSYYGNPYNPYYSPYYNTPYYGYYNTKPVKRGKGMNSNVTISRGNYNNYSSYRDNSNRRIRNRRTSNYSRNNDSYERVRTQNSPRIQYDRGSNWNNNSSWRSSNNSNWGNSSSTGSVSRSGGHVRFK